MTASRLERLLSRRDELERAVSRVQYNADMEVASLRASLDIVREAIREEADVYDRSPIARERILGYQCRIGGYDSNDNGE